MPVHWSSEIMKWEYRELQATAMSIDYSGNNVLLAGRRWLAIKHISLEDDTGGDIVKKYPRHSKYDAAGAEWCQTYQGKNLCAIASNQRVDVYDWRAGNDLTCICSLRGHTRVVSDTHFHRQDHTLIATCSIDTFTHLWDLRDARKPVISLCAVAGASQVQWNKVATHVVATAHDGDIKIWDYHDADGEDDNNSDSVSYSSTVGSVNDLSLADKNQDSQSNKISHKVITSIDEEFESIREMANIEVTDMNIETRTCQIHSERNGYVANLQVTFPRNVTEQTIPKFSWLSGTNVDSPTTIKILQAINKTAYRKKKEGHRCLLHCLKTLATSIDEIPVKSNDDSDSMKSSQRSQSESENAGDSCIPFPRTCGAKWCGVSTLVVFNRPPNARRLSLKHEAGTPRSMSSLSLTPGLFGGGYSSVSPHATTTPSPTNASGFPQLLHRHPSNSITTFYFQDRWKAQSRRAGNIRSRGSISGCSSPRVVLYAANNLFPLNRSLAEKYIINADDPIEMCERNAKVAADEGEGDIAHAWGLAALAARALAARLSDHLTSSEESMGWVGHPLCCNLVQALISHYAKASDVQMASMLASAFAVFNDTYNSSSQSTISTSSCGNGTSPYSTVNQYSEISADGWTLPIILRSNSCSEAENFHTDSTLSKSERASACVLDEATVHLYNCFKRVYADILHRWQLLYKRTEVMKLVGGRGERAQSPAGPEAVWECAWCARVCRGGACAACRRPALRCAVCALGVRGLAVACALCGHAGHARHLLEWFAHHDNCPTGCGCKCVIEGTSVWKGVKYV
ncbi:unnamed protein product, partial [Iphiclides podalirius]